MRILLLIRSWNRGGAERQFAQLTRSFASRGHEVIAGSLYAGGVFSKVAGESGALVVDFGKTGRFDVIAPLWRFVKLVRVTRPEIIYSFMPAANLMTTLASVASKQSTIVWGIRATRVDGREYGPMSRFMYWLERKLISVPELVICNSAASRKEIVEARSHGVVIIENGIDVERFRPDQRLRDSLRNQLGIDSTAMLIGIVARLDPMKDHETFLRAAVLVKAVVSNARFLVVGSDGGRLEHRLRERAATLGLQSSIVWHTAKDDVEAVYNALDVLVSSSAYGESFSNVIAEAMACGVPVVVTDVGDSARIVGSAGCVVKPRCAEALYGGVLEMVSRGRALVGAAARERIAMLYGIDKCVERTESLLAQTVMARRVSPRASSGG